MNLNKLHNFMYPFVKGISKKYIHGKLIIDNKVNYPFPAIYAVNHTNISDVPVVFRTLNKQTYILAGTKSQRLIDSIGFNLNGAIWVDRHSAKSKERCKKKMYTILNSGGNVMWFPEGTWNLSDNLLMLPIRWGIIKMAVMADVPIIPISIHYFDEKIYSKVGEPFYVNKNERAVVETGRLRDIMATMKYEQMEKCGVYSRNVTDKADFEALIAKSLDEYPAFHREYEETCVFKAEKARC